MSGSFGPEFSAFDSINLFSTPMPSDWDALYGVIKENEDGSYSPEMPSRFSDGIIQVIDAQRDDLREQTRVMQSEIN